MADAIIQSNFAGGEISPNLYARVDLEKYVTGAALMRNFFVDYRGGASNRAGFEYQATCRTASGNIRLLPFIFSQDQAYVLEFTEFNIRIYRLGAFICDIGSVYADGDLFALKTVQSADVLTIVHPDYPPYNLNRTSLTTFTITLVDIGTGIGEPTALAGTPTVVGTYQYGYMVTAFSADGEESLGSFPIVVASAVLDPTHATPKTIALSWMAVAGAEVYNVYKWGSVPAAQPLPTLFGYIGQTKTTTFTDTNIAPDYARVPPEYNDPFNPGQVTSISVATGGAGYSGYVALTIGGTGTGAKAYAVAGVSGAISGVVIQNTGLGYTTGTTVTPASGAATFTANVDASIGYPSVVSYFQQRRVYGGSDLAPELLNLSQSGAYDNFDTSPALLDSDAIQVNIASREVNTIKSLVPMSTGLVVFTTGMAFLISGSGDNSAITPAAVSATPQASTGASDIPPIVVNYNILFVQQQGSIVRDMAFSFQTQSYYGIDRSMLANHLFFGFTIIDWAWAEEPFKLLWVVRNDGVMLTMTYVPDQEIYGWARHDTNGVFRTVCVVPEENQDALYAVVERFIQEEGAWRYYLERLTFRTCDCPADAAYLDSFVSVPRIPGSDSLLMSQTGDVVDITFNSVNSTFVLSAEENFPSDVTSYMELHNNFETKTLTEQRNTGVGYNYPTREIFYYVQRYFYGFDSAVENTASYTLNDGGVNIVPPGDDILQSFWHTLWIGKKNIDTKAVTWYNTFDSNNLVPNGINGSDGTHRYLVADMSGEDNLPILVDPQTENVWMTMQSCELHCFRKEDNYAQTLFPLFPIDDDINNVIPLVITDDWVYAVEYDGASVVRLYCVPRERTAEETSQGYLLSYATYTWPASIANYAFRWAVDTNGVMFIFGNDPTTGKSFKLYKFEPPTSAPWGGPVVGGGFTDITPWAAGTGPNNIVATDFNLFPTQRNFIRYIPSGLGISNGLFCLFSTQYSGDYVAFTGFKLSYTTYDPVTHAFATTLGLVTEFMTAAWTTTTLANASYRVVRVMETNRFLGQVDQVFADPSSTLVYEYIWLYFVVLPVVNGVVDSNFKIVKARYFVGPGGPLLQSKFEEDLWDVNYPAYQTAIGNPFVIYKSMNLEEAGARLQGLDVGLYDETKNEFWWGGGDFDSNFENMCYLNPLFSYRTVFNANSPFLRIGFGPQAPAEGATGDIIDIGCASIRIDSVNGNTATGFLTEGELPIIPNDPFNTPRPINAGEWYLTQAVTSLSALHLTGMRVGLVVDGVVYPESIVPATGLVSWPAEYATTRAITGLPYTAQLQTLYLDVGEPTIQGKRKNIPAVTMRVDCTAGLKAGPDFDQLIEYKDMQVVYNVPPTHFTGDQRININNSWNKRGQICIQQDYPLPATVLGVIPEIVVGDNQR